MRLTLTRSCPRAHGESVVEREWVRLRNLKLSYGPRHELRIGLHVAYSRKYDLARLPVHGPEDMKLEFEER